MKNLKKILSLLLVGTIMVTSFLCSTVTAGAESAKSELISVALSSIDSKADGVTWLGQDLFCFTGENNKYKAIYRIGETELTNWRKTGTLKPSKVKLDSEVFSYDWVIPNDSGFDDTNSDYAIFFYQQPDGLRHSYASKYDREQNKITSFFDTADYSTIGITSNGTVSLFNRIRNSEKNVLTLKLIDSSGKLQKEKDYDLSAFTNSDCSWESPIYGRTYSVINFLDSIDPDIKGTSIMIIDEKGNEKTVFDGEAHLSSCGKNFIGYWLSSPYHFYMTDNNNIKTGTIIDLPNRLSSLNGYSIYDYDNEIFDNKFIIKYRRKISDNSYEYKYALYDFNGNDSNTIVYNYISSYDHGETYCVKNAEGKWGFLNKKGKELGWFDDAGVFKGDYTSVIKNNKLYLIDKNMTQITNSIKVSKDSSTYSFNENLYSLLKDGKRYIVTYKEGTTAKSGNTPASTTLTAKKTNGKYKLSWKAVSGITKYQIQYSTDGGKTYKSAGKAAASKTSVTLKLDTSKSYTFRIRSYKTVDGKKYYSSWSKPVTVK